MGPKRRNTTSSQRTPAYDPKLPENWTVEKLRKALDEIGVDVPSGCKRSRLVAMYKENTGKTRASATRASAQPAPQVNNQDGGLQEVWAAVKDLSSVVVDLKNTVQTLKPTSPTPSPNPQIPQLSDRIEPTFSPQPSLEHEGNNFNKDRQFNLASALAAYNGPSTSSVPPGQSYSGNYVRTQFGFAAESLPFVETVSPALRRQIIEGKDVNLASLLIPHFNCSTSDDKGKVDPQLHKSLTIGEFIQAFGIYKSIMCGAFPKRRQELDLYERDIIDMASKYGKSFYEYHKQFSMKAAAHLKYQNIPVDWSVRNNTLFCNIFADQKANTCHLCHSVTHTAGFCPQLVAPTGEVRKSNDSLGRQKVFSQFKEICNHFNGDKGCTRQRCSFLHVCLTCKKNHPRTQCTESKN